MFGIPNKDDIKQAFSDLKLVQSQIKGDDPDQLEKRIAALEMFINDLSKVLS